MPRKTGQMIGGKWARNSQGASQAMKDGVGGVTENPMDKAAAAVDRQVEGVRRAAAEGKTQARLRSVSLAAWKEKMIRKGIPRVAEGVTQAIPLVVAFHDQHQPVAEESSVAAKAAKAAGVGGRERMLANFDKMSGFRFQRPQS